ncbi:hypothetical protein NQ318_014884 [Aromia moschata]|uniref:Centrosomal and chromosomal factor n=1 Tax=Aromia moschata TaxID=1265417 RepID=A0AAV8YSV6_9CUCU|nr:hypothetical protein NQ318_014884 [Aromia moschata]
MSGASISYPHHRRGGFAATADRRASQSRTELRSASSEMATCYPAYELSPPQRTVQVPVQQKDYSRPLHVDCSVEYELPNTAKPPQGVRNEPLLMIHPCYFRKIESQRRSPFINNLPPARPAAAAVVAAVKRRMPRGQQLPQQVPQQAAQYPVQYAATAERQLWEPMVPPLVPISAAAQPYCKREPLVSACGQTYSSSGSDSGHWTDPDRSPDRPEEKHILSGKYRQYLRAHRLHPYVSSAIPLASTFPQIQQVCYNVSNAEPFASSAVSVTLLVIIVCNCAATSSTTATAATVPGAERRKRRGSGCGSDPDRSAVSVRRLLRSGYLHRISASCVLWVLWLVTQVSATNPILRMMLSYLPSFYAIKEFRKKIPVLGKGFLLSTIPRPEKFNLRTSPDLSHY